jgi:hypothetical protein
VTIGAAPGCAALGSLQNFVRAPKFDEAPGRRAEIRLVGPSLNAPVGGAAVRLWVGVSNPNAFAFTLSTLRGTLFLQEARAATMDLPLGLPLAARAETELPIDLLISFADVPSLSDAIRRAVNRSPIDYRLDGTVGVETGTLGSPEFGPLTFVRGTIGAGTNAVALRRRLSVVETIEHDLIPHAHSSTAHHVSIERKPAAESAADVLEHLRITFERVRINSGHRAAAAQGIEPHQRVRDMQLRACPLPFGHSRDPSNEDVRAKAPDVPPEHRHRSIGRHEQRQNVEPLETFVRFEPRIVAGGVLDECQSLRAVPRMTVDEWTRVGA